MRGPAVRFVVLSLLGVAAVAAGCRGGAAKATTPEACLKAFDQAMRDGNIEQAASLFAYGRIGADNNSDWGGFAPSQRDLIIKKMREVQVQQLSGFRGTYTQGGYQIQAIPTRGEWASGSLRGSRSSLPVRLYSRSGEWFLYSIGSLPPPTPG